MVAEVGIACGVCPKCGKRICLKRTVELAVCDCWMYCPLCGRKMEFYTSDTQALQFYVKGDLQVVMICRYHSPPYKSKQRPVEVMLN